jgi:triacylglycerol lipase
MKKIVLSLFALTSICGFAQNPFTPIIFVHGMLGSGDNWAKTVQLFNQQGYANNQLEVLDWNSIGGQSMGKVGVLLDSLIDDVLNRTGAKKVNLVGHSAGGTLCSGYLSKEDYASKVEKFILVGSRKTNTLPPIPILNLYSTDDRVIPGKDIEGINNKNIEGKDHFEIATSEESFKAMFSFFNPDVELIEISDEKDILPMLSGKVYTMGENQPEKGARVEVYPFDAKTGKRLNETPEYSCQTDDFGNWGPFTADPSLHYEFVVKPADVQKRTIHYYHAPFKESNKLIYLRILSSQGLISLLFQSFPTDPKQSILSVFSSNRAVINGRDKLTVDNTELSTEEFSSPGKTAIAYFLFDSNKNKKTDLTHIGAFKGFPFLNAIDYYIPSKTKEIKVALNEQSITIQPIPSSAGVMVVVFE